MEYVYTGKGWIEQINNVHYYTDEEIKKAAEFANNMLQYFENYCELQQENI